MRRALLATIVLAWLLAGCASRPDERVAPRDIGPSVAAFAPTEVVRTGLERLPVSFVANHGRWDPRASWVAAGTEATAYFVDGGVRWALTDDEGGWALDQLLVGARAARPTAPVVATGIVSYLGDQSAAGLPTATELTLDQAWPGVDVLWSGTRGHIEATYRLAPGADPAQVQVAWRGAESVTVTSDGRLSVTTPVRSFQEDAPRAFQDVAGRRVPVDVAYQLVGPDTYGFRLGGYDPTLPLIIDPAVLLHAGFLGGDGNEAGYDIALDGAGNAYVTGSTTSTAATFPETPGVIQAASGGVTDAFVAKVNAAGSTLLYATFLGGSDADYGRAIAVDGDGNAYLAGETGSTNFPTANAIQAANGGIRDAFVVKLNPAGSALVYATYLGGESLEDGRALAVDGAGNAYVTGYTTSSNFPTVNALQATNAGNGDAFVVKLNPAGSALAYATFLGGTGNDVASGIALDGIGDAYVTGSTVSSAFPTASPLQAAHAGGGDAFVVKLNPAGSALVYASYLGGAASDAGYDIAVDSPGNAYVTGFTTSPNFPTANAFQAANAGGNDAFVAKINPAGSALVYSTLLGGTGSDIAYGIAVDAAGTASIAGETSSTAATFPETPGVFQAASGGFVDAFVAKIADQALASPTITTQSSAGGPVGTPVRDVATLAGGANPTGTVTFRLFSDANCTTEVFTSTNNLAALTATSGDFAPAAAGTYRWTAVYNGDANNNSATSPCNAPNESVVITPFQAPAFTGTLTGDVLGPVTVNAGESVLITSARATGPVTVNPGGALTVVNSQITRGVSANAPAFFSMCGAQVSGPAPATALSVTGATVPIRVGDPATGCAGNRFAGHVVLTGNLAVTFGANTVSHNATIDNNGPGSTVVKANTLFGTLGCAGNNPAPTNAGQVNTAATKTGQCAGL
jgi:hypothetical protein